MSILKVENLTKQYKDKGGILNLNLEVFDKDIVLLLGPNGAGKTTTFKAVLGLVDCEYKYAEIDNNDIKINPVKSKERVGAMVSKPVFYEYLTGYEHLKSFGAFYNNVNDSSIYDMLNDVGLVERMHDKVSEYSTGMKQRLDLARALIHKPQLLILDEPFNGMDIEAKVELKKLIKEMQAKSKMGVIISSHMVGDLTSFANKVVIIYKGITLFSGTMDEVIHSGLTLEEFYLVKMKNYKSKEVA